MFYLHESEIYYFDGKKFYHTEVRDDVLHILSSTAKGVKKTRSATRDEIFKIFGFSDIISKATDKKPKELKENLVTENEVM